MNNDDFQHPATEPESLMPPIIMRLRAKLNLETLSEWLREEIARGVRFNEVLSATESAAFTIWSFGVVNVAHARKDVCSCEVAALGMENWGAAVQRMCDAEHEARDAVRS